MPHIDDGTLHALLDGALRATEPGRADAAEAHLETCAECRALAEEAAALRSRAGEILGVLEPSVTPDFDEVLVRAGAAAGGAAASEAAGPAGAGARRRLARQARRTRGLAWAATIVIALGTGYVIRDRLVPQRAARVDGGAPQTEAVEEARSVRRADSMRASLPQSAPSAPRVPGLDNRSAETSETTDGAAPAGGNGGRDAAADQVAAPPRPEEQLRQGEGTGEEIGVEIGEHLVDEPEKELVPGAGQIAAPLQASVSRSLAEIRQPPASVDVMAPAVPMEARNDDPNRLVEVAPEEVAGLGGGPLLQIRDAEIVRTWVSGAEAGPVVVSLQRLPDGTEVRVRQRAEQVALSAIVVTGRRADSLADSISAGRAQAGAAEAARAAAPAAPPAAAPSAAADQAATGGRFERARLPGLADSAAAAAVGLNTVRVPVIGYDVVLQGPLPADELRRLGILLRPYEPER